MDIEGKTALVVGAGRGIGRRVAELFSNAGSNVVVSLRTETELLELEYKLNSNGGHDVLALAADAARPDDTRLLVDQTLERFGSIEFLVIAAGKGILKPFGDLTLKEFEISFRQNTETAFNVLHAVLPSMKEKKFGRIVAIPGVLGKASMMSASAYCASKYALTGMIKCLKEEYKRDGIRFSLMHVGGVDSTFWDEISLKVDRGRMLSVDAAAKAVFFAATREGEGVMSEVVLLPNPIRSSDLAGSPGTNDKTGHEPNSRVRFKLKDAPSLDSGVIRLRRPVLFRKSYRAEVRVEIEVPVARGADSFRHLRVGVDRIGCGL
ncbi:MAG TPA: SDR family oxidoreductase [Aridibacter sp.]|nr:SDR family oxidoreductase [Aridibacter sp.]